MKFIDLEAQQKLIRKEIDKRINAVLNHGQYILGPEIQELEDKLAEFVNVQFCITASSGTDTLTMAMMALGIGYGDEVITTPFTYIATAETISLLGAKPVFVDIDESSFNINTDLIEKEINERTKAIMPVSLFGQCSDMDRINNIAKKYGLIVIEDAAQSFGATYKGKPSCSLSAVGSTSFFPAKPLGCYGDGGALFTDDHELAESFKEIRVHGQSEPYNHTRKGINGRMDTIQAAILLAKLDIYPDEIMKRQEIAERYNQGLSDYTEIPVVSSFNRSVFAQYTIKTDKRDTLKQELNEAGIPTAIYYPIPLHLQKVFGYLGYSKGNFPVSERVSGKVLSLPMHPYLDKSSQNQIIQVILKNI